MPYRVIDIYVIYSIVDTPYVHLWTYHPSMITRFQTSSGIEVENLFISDSRMREGDPETNQ